MLTEDHWILGVHQQYGATPSDPRHALPQRDRVARRKLVDAARAHEGFEPEHAAVDQRVELVDVSGHQAAPDAEIRDRRFLGGGELEIERVGVDRHRQAVQRHVDVARVTAGGQRARPAGNRLPLRAARLVEVHVSVDSARKDVKAGCVDLLGGLHVKPRPDLDDATVRECNVRLDHSRGRDHAAGADDSVDLAGQAAASRSMKWSRTSIAVATSSTVTDSAGLWLTPPLQRTNSIPISVIDAIATPSWPAPLGRCSTSSPASSTARDRSSESRGEHGTAAFSLSGLTVT